MLGGYPQDGSVVDSAVIWFIATFVDGRAFPMFGVLFGYGVAQIARRQEGLGPRAVRRLLLTALLFFLLTALPGDGSLTISADPPDVSMLPPDVFSMIVDRAQVSLYVSLLGPIGFAGPFMIGLWAGRRRVLESPERHRALLRFTATAGIGAALLGAQPIALILAGELAPPTRLDIVLLWIWGLSLSERPNGMKMVSPGGCDHDIGICWGRAGGADRHAGPDRDR